MYLEINAEAFDKVKHIFYRVDANGEYTDVQIDDFREAELSRGINSNILYKYRTLDVAKIILNNRNLRFTQPSGFNDRFDCYENLISTRLSKSDTDIFLEKIDKSFPVNEIKRQIDEQIDCFRQKVKILSLSYINNDILMWLHYADNHKGVVFGFDKQIEFEYNTPLREYTKGNVFYFDHKKSLIKCDLLTAMNSRHSAYAIGYLITAKSKKFAYEHEHRIALAPHSQDVEKASDGPIDIDFNKSALKEIVFGCNTLESDRKEIINLANSLGYNVKIFIAHPNPNRFGVDILPFN